MFNDLKGYKFSNTRLAFVPPKPNEFFSTILLWDLVSQT